MEMWSDGRRYEGEFKNGIKDGEGTFEWPNGKKYIGTWKNNKQHGKGEITLPKGSSKKGEWVNGKRVKWDGEAGKEEQGEERTSTVQ